MSRDCAVCEGTGEIEAEEGGEYTCYACGGNGEHQGGEDEYMDEDDDTDADEDGEDD